jgi:ketosteroid isomerase-like protein
MAPFSERYPTTVDNDSLTAELYAREKAAWEIFLRKDKTAYAEGYAEDAIGFDLTGKLKDKSAAVDDINAADTWTGYEIRDFAAESIAPGVALVHYFATVAGIVAGQPFEVRMFIGAIFVQRDGRWLLRYFQNTATA